MHFRPKEYFNFIICLCSYTLSLSLWTVRVSVCLRRIIKQTHYILIRAVTVNTHKYENNQVTNTLIAQTHFATRRGNTYFKIRRSTHMKSLWKGSPSFRGGLRGEGIIKDYFPALNEFASGGVPRWNLLMDAANRRAVYTIDVKCIISVNHKKELQMLRATWCKRSTRSFN